MQAISITAFGAAEVLQRVERPAPVPAADAVLIQVAAAGVNRADLLQRQGKYPPPAEAPPDIPGLEVSGTVNAVGANCVRFRVGDQVMALLPGGGYAEQVTVAEALCLPIPAGVCLRDASALPEALFTVWANLFVAAQVRPGETVLVHGGASGIGSMAIQLLRAHGAVPFVTVGNVEKADWCRSLGAVLAINYREADFSAAVIAATQGRGVDVILDMVGGAYLPRNLACLAPLGRLVWISTQQGLEGTLDIRAVMRRRAIITGTTLRARSAAEKMRLAHSVERRLLPWVAQGVVKPLISHYFPLVQAAAAHKVLETGANHGKVLLEVSV
ncbi:MAG: NAD(P)H-quinone oxidoreductase [Alphaproteobacteria bacterium]|nr:NAD(P)H-quinone oxidoreductase [Alphaproteobacteria bacterium]